MGCDTLGDIRNGEILVKSSGKLSTQRLKVYPELSLPSSPSQDAVDAAGAESINHQLFLPETLLCGSWETSPCATLS